MDGDVRFAMVQEADVAESLVMLRTRAPGTTRIVVVVALPGLHASVVTDVEGRRAAFGGRVPAGLDFDARAGEKLVGAKVHEVSEASVLLDLRDGTRMRLEAVGGRVRLRPADDATPARVFAEATPDEITAWSARAAETLPRIGRAGVTASAKALAGTLRKAETKLARRAEAIGGDLEKMARTTALAANATWLVAAAKKAPRGATELSAIDYGTGEPIVMRLDPGKPAMVQLEALFRKAKRLREGRVVADKRLAETRDAIGVLVEARSALGDPELDATTLAAIARRAKDAAPRDVRLGKDAASTTVREGNEKRRCFRHFQGSGGTRILVGRGGEDNETLTFKLAAPHDMWLHAKERNGAHVIVPLAKGKGLPEGVLVEAALLAAHFSDARDEAIVDVQYTPRKHLRKPAGGKKGLAVVSREKVLVLRVDRAAVARLLDREET